MHLDERIRLRELTIQMGALCLVAIAIVAMILCMPGMRDGGIMKLTAACAALLAAITATQIGRLVSGVRRRIAASRTAAMASMASEDAAEPDTESAAPIQDEEPDEHVRKTMSAQTDEDAYTPSSQFREIVEHERRTIAVPRAPKGPHLVYAPRGTFRD